MSSLRICLVSSEVTPFAKTGGLADVTAALARHLVASGHEVRVVMPYYRRIARGGYEIAPVRRLTGIPLRFPGQEIRFAVQSGYLPGSEVPVYFLDCPELYDRDEIYSDGGDEHLRFAVLSRATLDLCQWTAWAPGIVHCNDWHTGLLPLYLKTLYAWDQLFRSTRSVLTIHNIGYQGMFPATVLATLGLNEIRPHFHQEDLHAGHVNFLKTGLLYADALTTVSETYAREIRTAELGMGLQDVLEARRSVLHGIVNGVDYQEWNPGRDPLIPHRYSARDLNGKAANKRALLAHFGLPESARAPTLGIVSRLTAQKGFELLPDVLPVLLHREDMRVCVLGSGEAKYERYFAWLRDTYPSKVGFHCGYSEPLAHLIEAGSDMFVMPSRYEPCGLNQMYSLRYGTVPVVRRTGGLADTVRQWDARTEEGTGFLFDEFTPEALFRALSHALLTYQEQKSWARLVRNGMAEDWSWDRQVHHYIDLYRRLAEAV